ncbi:hypothetical protein SOVF_090050 isoform A [Spinacia oleracea]|uniref:Protection of telomeres protein 1 n=1 Tax=Spinacia oleracea TaxID=3562 RepID=A0A9R0J0Q5_SPIOL|nr:protection of telomeres protein 1b-like isoform X2 [Spinacia oleracea]KNA16321.1 hypothetical protein SOVF_090050 isoform A [Spinacia oleracea]
MRDRDDYRFLRLADAMTALNQKVNLIGIITEYGAPTRSRGTDWFCSLRIVDESHNIRGLLVNIFAETQEKLPQAEASGDIIQLFHVMMKIHKMETYALYNKKFSSFALYEGKYGGSCNPYKISSKFQPRNQDMTYVVSLRKWVESFQLDTVSNNSVLLRHIKEGQCYCYDLVCKILHISQVNQDEWMLFVWDGSDAPPLQLQSELETEKDHSLPLQLEPQPLAREALCKFPTIGTILRVSVNQRNVKLNIPSLSPGRWVKFINLMLKVHEGLWFGVLNSSTKVRFVPIEDVMVVERQRDFEKRLSSKFDRMPFTSFPWPIRITVDDEVEDVPLVTLMDIMTYQQATGKYKCIVRVVAALPWTVKDFRSPDGTYRVRLTLEDPTGRIHAYLYAEDGKVFFEGYPPLDALIRKWNTLLGVAEDGGGGVIKNAPRNPPWVLCCIKSYYLNKNDVWGSRKFRIFDTKLVC